MKTVIAVMLALSLAACWKCTAQPGYDAFMQRCLEHQEWARCEQNARLLGHRVCE